MKLRKEGRQEKGRGGQCRRLPSHVTVGRSPVNPEKPRDRSGSNCGCAVSPSQRARTKEVRWRWSAQLSVRSSLRLLKKSCLTHTTCRLGELRYAPCGRSPYSSHATIFRCTLLATAKHHPHISSALASCSHRAADVRWVLSFSIDFPREMGLREGG